MYEKSQVVLMEKTSEKSDLQRSKNVIDKKIINKNLQKSRTKLTHNKVADLGKAYKI